MTDEQLALHEHLLEGRAINRAKKIQAWLDQHECTVQELAIKSGISRSHLSNLLRLLSLPVEVQIMVDEDRLSMGAARALLPCKDAPNIMELAERARLMSAREVENMMRQELGRTKKSYPDRGIL